MSLPPDAIMLKRAYEPPSADDGTRVLVERLWPRGLSKLRAQIHLWLKEVAPSASLRTWYGHEPARFDEFRRRYRDELAAGDAYTAVERLRAMARSRTLTLVFAARAAEISSAAVLREVLTER